LRGLGALVEERRQPCRVIHRLAEVGDDDVARNDSAPFALAQSRLAMFDQFVEEVDSLSSIKTVGVTQEAEPLTPAMQW
jgi:hypothetical protein